MIASNAAIVDLSTLNVLFRCDGKFTAALNYSNALDRLGSTLAALGPGYDLYLCLRPRQVGEGDFNIQELSLSAVPFVTDSLELKKAITFFRDCRGVNEIYLCNWLNNFVEKARTDSFESAFYYGDRVARVVVKNKLITEFTIYDSVQAFTDIFGDGFEGYGDFNLVDIDGFKAQYPEFALGTKVNLMTLAPLAHCCSTQCYVNAEMVLDRLQKSVEPEPEPKSEPVPEPNPEPKPLENFVPSPGPVETKVKGKTPPLAVLFVSASFLLAIVLGVCFSYTRNGYREDQPQTYYDELDMRTTRLQKAVDVYQRTSTATFDLVSAYDYVGKSGLEVTIAGFERYPDQYIVRCDCASEDIFDQFVAYMEKTYSVISTNDLGMTGEGENVVRHFSVMFN